MVYLVRDDKKGTYDYKCDLMFNSDGSVKVRYNRRGILSKKG